MHSAQWTKCRGVCVSDSMEMEGAAWIIAGCIFSEGELLEIGRHHVHVAIVAKYDTCNKKAHFFHFVGKSCNVLYIGRSYMQVATNEYCYSCKTLSV